MSKLTPLKYESVVKKLKQSGFRFYREGKGSHELWVRDWDGQVVSIPKRQGKDIKKGTLKSIIKATGLATKEFMKL